MNMNQQLLKVVTDVCKTHHPDSDQCFTISDIDFEVMFQRQNFLKADCPALQLYHSVFGSLNLKRHHFPREQNKQAPQRKQEVFEERFFEVWSNFDPSHPMIDDSYIEICTRNLSTLPKNMFLLPLLCFKLNLERHLKFASELLQTLQYLKEICAFLPSLLVQMLDSLTHLREVKKQRYTSNSARMNQLYLSNCEALHEAAEPLARMNDTMVEFLTTTSRLQRILWMGETDATLVASFNDFQSRQREISQMTPFCDYKYIVETLAILLSEISEASDETQRGGDIQVSEDDLEKPRMP